MRRTATALLTATCLALAGCSGSSDSTDTKAAAKTTSKSPAKPKKLEPKWGTKLDVAGGEDAEAVGACTLPSSNACARYVEDIMGVVSGLADAIDETGRAYPESSAQIAKMRKAEKEYVHNGCQGDPTADDPNSVCSGVVGVTMGAASLQMTLSTDEASL